MGEPTCKIARENGGKVPLDCLFSGGCKRDCDHGKFEPTVPLCQIRCNRCGSTNLRWHQQAGKWVLFNTESGKLHVCVIPDDFDVVPE